MLKPIYIKYTLLNQDYKTSVPGTINPTNLCLKESKYDKATQHFSALSSYVFFRL